MYLRSIALRITVMQFSDNRMIYICALSLSHMLAIWSISQCCGLGFVYIWYGNSYSKYIVIAVMAR